jgi:hypothetical protein
MSIAPLPIVHTIGNDASKASLLGLLIAKERIKLPWESLDEEPIEALKRAFAEDRRRKELVRLEREHGERRRLDERELVERLRAYEREQEEHRRQNR